MSYLKLVLISAVAQHLTVGYKNFVKAETLCQFLLPFTVLPHLAFNVISVIEHRYQTMSFLSPSVSVFCDTFYNTLLFVYIHYSPLYLGILSFWVPFLPLRFLSLFY